MAVRLRIKVSGKEVEETALLNSGYESQEPELAIPISVAEKPGLRPLCLREREKVRRSRK